MLNSNLTVTYIAVLYDFTYSISVLQLNAYSFFSVSKYFLSTGFTMKCSAEAKVTRPAIVYMVSLYRNGLKQNNIFISIYESFVFKYLGSIVP